MADDCSPIKLEVVAGVAVVAEAEDDPAPLTPPAALTSEFGPLPFGHLGASGLSSTAADATAAPRFAAVTTWFVNDELVDWNVKFTLVLPAADWVTPVASAAAIAATDATAKTRRGCANKPSHLP